VSKGLVAIFSGVVGTMTLRVLTVDLTEGQALLRYWWGWAICLALVVGGTVIVKKEDK
jgi:hypothetical protein